MSIKLRYPDFDIPGLQQVRSYLYQVVDELNFALANMETQAVETKAMGASATSGKTAEETAQSSFNSIKSLIIKSADIVNAYYEEISQRLEGSYVAKSAFGTYSEETAQTIKANSSDVEQLFENIQKITTDVDTLIKATARIKSGLLYYNDPDDEDNYIEEIAVGAPVYGLEIGESVSDGETETFNQFARFVANRLTFYDSNGNKVSWISDKKLHIKNAEITVSFIRGGLVDTVLSDGSVVTKHIASGGGK